MRGHARRDDQDIDRRPGTDQQRSRSRGRMGPSRREAIWGLVFVAPWIIGFLAVHDRAADRVADLLADRLRPRPAGGGALRRSGQLRSARRGSPGRPGPGRHGSVRDHRHPRDHGRKSGCRAPRQQSTAVRSERLPDPVLHADPDPPGGQHPRLDRVPEHRDRLAQRPAAARRDRRARLAEQRDLGLPGADADRAVGHRQLHADQPRRPPVGADRAVRGGPHRRGRTRGACSGGSRSR